MYDSIEALYVPQTKMADAMWSDERVTHGRSGQVIKRWYNSRDGALRLNHWLGHDDIGILKVAFNVPQVVGLSGRVNVTDADRDAAFVRVNQWLNKHFGALPDVQSWQCQRIDYAWNWTLGSRLMPYLATFQGLSYGTRSRTTYASGVSWLGGKHGRAVVVYHKDKTMDDGLDDGVLRYEVQNKRAACKYAARRWFGCDQSVGEMARSGRALYVMARSWQALGLDVRRSYTHMAALRSRLRDVYGAAAGAAFSALDLITLYGRQCVDADLMSLNMYYTWKRRLRSDGFLAPLADVLTDGSDEMIALNLPARDVIAAARQNLESSDRGSLSFLLKNSWEKLSDALGLLDTAPKSDYLLRFYDATE